MALRKLSRPPSGRPREGKQRTLSSQSKDAESCDVLRTQLELHTRSGLIGMQKSNLIDSGVCEKNVHRQTVVFKRRPPAAPNLNVGVSRR